VIGFGNRYWVIARLIAVQTLVKRLRNPATSKQTTFLQHLNLQKNSNQMQLG